MGECAPKKRNFLVNIFQKVPKTPFKNFACGTENLVAKRVFIVIWESSENQFGRPKKEENPRFPRLAILSTKLVFFSFFPRKIRYHK